ncbi:MAG: histidine ammonia-lyase, partial [Cyclobacteriaceae bacterium]|nr:histidine ammonia-lyase [Cyclobacteriaceae bacterium]
AQAFDFRKPLQSGPVLEACHNLVREHIDHAEEDRIFAQDIKKAHFLIASGALHATAVENSNKQKIDINGPQHEPYRFY